MLAFADAFVWPLRLLAAALPWYMAVQILALLALPLVFGICTRLHDRGYAIAKAIGLLLTTYFVWLLGLAGRSTPFFVGFSMRGILMAEIVLLILALAGAGRRLADMLAFVRQRWALIGAYEAIFLAAFTAMLALRAAVPQITYVINDSAAEKFTDFAVLNGLLMSPGFPPRDPWVSGEPLNYYYFGHLMWAVLIRLTSYAPEVGFNLALATVFALVCVQSASLGFNATGRLRWGLLAMFLVALSSNLDGTLQALQVAVEWLDGSHRASPWYAAYNYWRPSRAIENTINEFPAFSFILGDLHAHLSSLVLLLAALVLMLQVWRHARGEASLLRFEWNGFGELFLLAVLIGAMSAANSWDVITVSAVLAAVLWASRPAPAPGPAERTAVRLLAGIEVVFLTGLLVFAATRVLFAGFFRTFQPPFEVDYVWSRAWPFLHILASPLRLVMVSNRTHPAEFFTHWVLLLAPPAALLIGLAWTAGRGGGRLTGRQGAWPGEPFWALTALAVAALSVLLVVLQGLVAAVLAVTSAGLLGALVAGRQPPAVRLILALSVVFTGLTLFCEIFYLDDIFHGETERINTVFKVYYGLWPVAVLVCVLSLRRVVRYAPSALRRRRAALAVTAILLGGGFYAPLGVAQRLDATSKPPPPASALEALDGMRYLALRHPGDYGAILFLRAEARKDTILLETPGTQYSYAGRISTCTGIPSLGGWLYHAWAWRPAHFLAERDRRIQAAQEIYSARDPAEAYRRLRQERVTHVVVGDLERSTYPLLSDAVFEAIGQPVYSAGGTTVYRLHENLHFPDGGAPATP